MKLHLHHIEIPLKQLFTISRGTMRQQQIVIVELEDEGVRGFGEATTNAYYNVTIESLRNSFQRSRSVIETQHFTSAAQLWEQLSELLDEDPFALSAIDAAAHDLFGKQLQQQTFETLGLQWNGIPRSSYTIGLDSIDRMVANMKAKSDWGLFKIKLGTVYDLEIVRQLRQHTDAPFRVDANCGWTPEEAIEKSYALKELGVEFIEQPLPASASAKDNFKVYKNSALPVIADESCRVELDVKKCHGLFHGINIKLCKCGGITPGYRMLRQARELGMKTMIGCMVESSIGISAAAHLLPLLDYADLDGAELLGTEIAAGVSVTDGIIRLSEDDGLGIRLYDSIVAGSSVHSAVKTFHR